MATLADGPQEPPTLANKAQTCIVCFQRCLHEAELIHRREFSMVEDQLGRFAVWTASMRVFGASRQSLDHRLREASDVRTTFEALLEAMIYRIENCNFFSWHHLKPSEDSRPSDYLGSTGISSLGPTNLQQSDGALGYVDEVFYQAVCGVADQISLLHKLSNTIRRASKEAQNLDAAKAVIICDDEGNDAEDFLRQLYLHYIQDRFPVASAKIQQRLASTMILRRKRILYRQSRYNNNPISDRTSPRNADAHENIAAVQSGVRSAIKSVAQSATTLAVDSFRKASAPSVVSVNTIALSRHENLSFPPAPTLKIKAKHPQLVKKEQIVTRSQTADGDSSRGSENNLPAPNWKDAASVTVDVTCPLCFCTLSAHEVGEEMKWRRHVVNDLDAYVCLFEECDTPQEMYSHSSQWLKHMSEHTLSWRCDSKTQGEFVVTSKEDYVEHLRIVHQPRLTDTQLRLLADKSCRAVGKSFEKCPLCGFQDASCVMEEHIVGDLRLLALKCLPAFDDGSSDDADSVNTGGSALGSRSTVREFVKTDSNAEDISWGSQDGHKEDDDTGGTSKTDRTMTDIYSDELYNPNFTMTSMTRSPSQPSHTTVSPNHEIFAQRLKAANSQHLSATQSPVSSPFRQDSPLAPTAHEHHQRETTLGNYQRFTAHQASLRQAMAQRSTSRGMPQTISPKNDSDQQQKLRQLPQDKSNELFGNLGLTSMPLHAQSTQGIATHTQERVVNPIFNEVHQSIQGGVDPQTQQVNLQDTTNPFPGGNPLQHPQAQMIMDNMELPPDIRQVIPDVPPAFEKWSQVHTWLSQTNAPIPDQLKQILRNIQLSQFKRMVMSHGENTGQSSQKHPDLQYEREATARALADLPPNTPIPEVTAEEVRHFRIAQQDLKDAPEEQIRLIIQRLKIQRMRQAIGVSATSSRAPNASISTVESLPPIAPVPEVTAQQTQMFPTSHREFNDTPEEQGSTYQYFTAPLSATQVEVPPTSSSHEQRFQSPPPADISVRSSPPPAVSTRDLKRRGDDLEPPTQRNAYNGKFS